MTDRWYPDFRGFTGDAYKDDKLDKAFRIAYDRTYSLQGRMDDLKSQPQPQAQQKNPLATGISGVTPSIGPSQAPLNSQAPGVPGQVTYDGSYFYVYIGGAWKRASLSSF